VVEAMANGVPVVAARGGAHIETVGEDGFLFDPGDVDAAATCLVRLAENQDLRVSVGRRLRARQNALFSLDEHVLRLEELYQSLARGK
jgi:glycosyltransferase involved in cell wall biosynthesis